MPLGLDTPPPAAGPPGAPGAGAGPPPMMPKSPTGGPGGPGASPMLSPGSGAGNRAGAVQLVKTAMPALIKASMAFEMGSKEQQALFRAISSLNPIFGKGEGTNMVPAGLASLAEASKQGPLSAAPPPGIKPTNTPPPGMEPPGGEGEGP